MSEARPRSWSLDERIDALEPVWGISPPFTQDERALARAASEALYFAHELTEMPTRLPEDATGRCLYLDWGIHVVDKRREKAAKKRGT